MAASALTPFNFSLPSASGMWVYNDRNRPADLAWNSSYTNSPTWPPAESTTTLGQGKNYFRTQNAAAQVGITFQGTALYLCFTDNDATYVLTVDGTAPANGPPTSDPKSDPACADYAPEATKMIVIGGLDGAKSHSVQMRVSASAEHEFRFFGGLVSVGVTGSAKGGQVSNRTFDDTDPGFVYFPGKGSGQWDTTGGGTGLYNLTSTFNCGFSKDNRTEFTFTGAGAVALYGVAYRDTHFFSVKLESKSSPSSFPAILHKSDFSTSGWSIAAEIAFLKGNLDTKETYLLTYLNYNEDNPECRGIAVGGIRFCCAGVDAVRLFSVDSSQATQSGQGADGKKSSNLGAILGGVFGGLAFIALLAVLAFLFLRRRRRQNVQPKPEPQWNIDNGHPVHISNGGHPQQQEAYVAAEPWSYSGATSTPGPTTSSSGMSAHRDRIASPYQPPPPGASPPQTSRSEKLARIQGEHIVQGQSAAAVPVPPSQSGDSSSGVGAAATPAGGRLAPEDLDQVLAFVAQRMDGARAGGPPAGYPTSATSPSFSEEGTFLPPYQPVHR